ncbi:MAG: hypothetical protein IKH38_02750 [Clostridia bacterium]|nr:hypothetical protein [Clostridia bacterium]
MRKRICLGLVLLLCWMSCAGAEIVSFDYAYSTDLPTVHYEIFRLGDTPCLWRDRTLAQPVDAETLVALEEIVERFEMRSWDGFDRSNPYVMDGEMFRLDIVFADGTEVHATGDNAFPQHYREAVAAITTLLQDLPEESDGTVPGTYRYEGEGFGGDFTLTLLEDGTYTFYEGLLSSYMGGGEWSMEQRFIYLSEANGLSLYNTLIPMKDTLVFVAEGSDGFLYVQVPDGGRFVRVQDTASE